MGGERSGYGLGQPAGPSSTGMHIASLATGPMALTSGTSLVWDGKGRKTRGAPLEVEGLSSGKEVAALIHSLLGLSYSWPLAWHLLER